MATDTPFSSSVLVIAYHVDDHNRSGLPQRIDPDEPFPLRETMLTAARELKVITDVAEAARDAAARRDLRLTEEYFHVQAEPERMARLVRDTEALQDLAGPVHLHPALEFGLMSWVRDQADPTASVTLQIGVAPNGSFVPRVVEAQTRDGQSYSGPLPSPSKWREILDDGRAWENVAADVVNRHHRAGVNQASAVKRDSGADFRQDPPKIGERIRKRWRRR